MIIGAEQGASQTGTTDNVIDYIFDVSTEDFEEKVVKPSMTKPVLVDFWAPWCGPCKSLMPVLEDEVKKAQGAVQLAKVNIDDNQQLAGMLRVQSVPTVYAFYQGQPVTGFQGNQPASQIAAIINQLIEMSGAQVEEEPINIDEMLSTAEQALDTGHVDGAMGLYQEILNVEPSNAKAYCALAKILLQQNQHAQAMAMYEQAPEIVKKSQEYQALGTTIELLTAQSSAPSDSLKAKLAENAQDHETSIALAESLFKEGKEDQAIETLLASITFDREWNDGAAKALLLKFFESLGHAHPSTIAGRKKLSSVLFS